MSNQNEYVDHGMPTVQKCFTMMRDIVEQFMNDKVSRADLKSYKDQKVKDLGLSVRGGKAASSATAGASASGKDADHKKQSHEDGDGDAAVSKKPNHDDGEGDAEVHKKPSRWGWG